MNTELPTDFTLPLREAQKNDWYHHPSDPRCPHDGWLARLEFVIEGSSGNEGECFKTLRIVLLAAYHNGLITFDYKNVRLYQVTMRREEVPGKIWRRQDWLEDSAMTLENGVTQHRISWENETWLIEATEINYQWTVIQ